MVDVICAAETAIYSCDGNEEPLYTEGESERLEAIIAEVRGRLKPRLL